MDDPELGKDELGANLEVDGLGTMPEEDEILLVVTLGKSVSEVLGGLAGDEALVTLVVGM